MLNLGNLKKENTENDQQITVQLTRKKGDMFYRSAPIQGREFKGEPLVTFVGTVQADPGKTTAEKRIKLRGGEYHTSDKLGLPCTFEIPESWADKIDALDMNAYQITMTGKLSQSGDTSTIIGGSMYCRTNLNVDLNVAEAEMTSDVVSVDELEAAEQASRQKSITRIEQSSREYRQTRGGGDTERIAANAARRQEYLNARAQGALPKGDVVDVEPNGEGTFEEKTDEEHVPA